MKLTTGVDSCKLNDQKFKSSSGDVIPALVTDMIGHEISAMKSQL